MRWATQHFEVGRASDLGRVNHEGRFLHTQCFTFKQSIGDLDDRQAMLYDLRVRLNYIQQDLATLLAAIPTIPIESARRAGP